MTEAIRQLLTEFRAGLEKIYGARLRGVYLFGSYARGEEDPESDVDVLIVLDDYERYGAEIARTSELNGGLSLKWERSISRVFVREQDWTDGAGLFLGNVREEAVQSWTRRR